MSAKQSPKKVTLSMIKGKPFATSVPAIHYHASDDELQELYFSSDEDKKETLERDGSSSKDYSSCIRVKEQKSTESDAPKNNFETAGPSSDATLSEGTPPSSDPWKVFSEIKGKITKTFEEKLSEIKSDKRKKGRSSKDIASISDSEDVGVTRNDENTATKQQKEPAVRAVRRRGNPARYVGFSRVRTGLKDKGGLDDCVESGVEAAEFSEDVYEAVVIESDVKVEAIATSMINTASKATPTTIPTVSTSMSSTEVEPETTLKTASGMTNPITSSKVRINRDDGNSDICGLKRSEVFSMDSPRSISLGKLVSQMANQLLLQLAYRSATFVGIAFCLYYFTPLPEYLLGFCVGALATITFYSTISRAKKMLTDTPNQKSLSSPIVPVVEIPAVEEHAVVERFEGWLNELPYSYDPNNYHVARTKSVFFRLEGTVLRIMETRMKIPKRTVWDEPRHKLKFTKCRVYSLVGAKVDLLPEGLIRRRRWSKKYPICVTFKPGSLISNVSLRKSRKNATSSCGENRKRKPAEKRKTSKVRQNHEDQRGYSGRKSRAKQDEERKDRSCIGEKGARLEKKTRVVVRQHCRKVVADATVPDDIDKKYEDVTDKRDKRNVNSGAAYHDAESEKETDINDKVDNGLYDIECNDDYEDHEDNVVGDDDNNDNDVNEDRGVQDKVDNYYDNDDYDYDEDDDYDDDEDDDDDDDHNGGGGGDYDYEYDDDDDDDGDDDYDDGDGDGDDDDDDENEDDDDNEDKNDDDNNTLVTAEDVKGGNDDVNANYNANGGDVISGKSADENKDKDFTNGEDLKVATQDTTGNRRIHSRKTAVSRLTRLKYTFHDCQDFEGKYDETKIYIFARADRQKEDWYRRLVSATLTRGTTKTRYPSLSLSSKDATATFRSNISIGRRLSKPEGHVTIPVNHTSETATEFGQSAYTTKYLDVHSPCPTPESVPSASASNDSVLWLNCLMARILFDMHNCPDTITLIQDKIQRKLSNIKLPYFMECLLVSEVTIGQESPVIDKASTPTTDDRGLWFDLNITYNGSFTMTVETKLNLMKLTRAGSVSSNTSDILTAEKQKSTIRSPIFDSDVEDTPETSTEDDNVSRTQAYSASKDTTHAQSSGRKFLSMVDKITANKYFQHATELSYIRRAMEGVSNTEIRLMVTVSAIEGCLCINIPPPPSDRLWYGFKPVPKISLTVRPAVGERTVNIVYVTKWIEAKLLREFEKLVVLPNMDDIVLTLCPNYPYIVSRDN